MTGFHFVILQGNSVKINFFFPCYPITIKTKLFCSNFKTNFKLVFEIISISQANLFFRDKIDLFCLKEKSIAIT